ncbi:MAG: TfoX/Sxy family protein [Oscillospiraceae bacterium]|nr:TfoX/Sxy family protein [Oscillospiraceae bacterium]
MEFKDFVCEKLKNAGDVKAKKMFGTYNICLDGVNLGLLCEKKWYLKKTDSGDAFTKENGLAFETGIKGNSYIVTDFSDEKMICALAKITRGDIIKSKT